MSHSSMAAFAAVAVLSMVGCSKEAPESSPPAAHTTAVPPVASTPSALPSAPAPTASVETPVHDCPKGSEGMGSSKSPCEAKGKARMMEAVWTGKISDDGPSFRITNKSDTPILYGKVAVYYYDKAGKQLQVTDSSGKTHPYQQCSGASIFGGVMKPSEKAVVTFSCVPKKSVPEGATAIEAEVQMVGFADATEKHTEYYWRNEELTPEARAKGGVK